MAWGNNDVGQLNVPPAATQPGSIIKVVASGNWSMALTHTGALVCWGQYSKCPSTTDLGNQTVTDIVAGYSAGMALLSNGTAVTWRALYNGFNVMPVPEQARAGVQQIAMGGGWFGAIQTVGSKLVAWGYISTKYPVVTGLMGVLGMGAGPHNTLYVVPN